MKANRDLTLASQLQLHLNNAEHWRGAIKQLGEDKAALNLPYGQQIFLMLRRFVVNFYNAYYGRGVADGEKPLPRDQRVYEAYLHLLEACAYYEEQKAEACKFELTTGIG